MQIQDFYLQIQLLFILGLLTLPAHAQLFEDLEKRDNVINNKWVAGVDVGASIVSYRIDKEIDFNTQNVPFLGENYTGVGLHIGGKVLRSFEVIKIGLAPSFERFSGTSLQTNSDYSQFNNVAVNNLNINLRAEIYLTSSVEGGLFVNLEGGISLLSGDIPGSEVGTTPNGLLGAGFLYRLNDKVGLSLEINVRFFRFENEFLNEELRHKYFSGITSIGLVF